MVESENLGPVSAYYVLVKNYSDSASTLSAVAQSHVCDTIAIA